MLVLCRISEDMVRQGLVRMGRGSDNHFMTITYRDGKTVQAVLLSRSENTLRVAVPGDQDVQTLHCVNGTWISELCEPVTIEFEWQRKKREHVPVEADCVCPKELAAKLIERLYNPEHDELQEQLQRLYAEQSLGGLFAPSPSLLVS